MAKKTKYTYIFVLIVLLVLLIGLCVAEILRNTQESSDRFIGTSYEMNDTILNMQQYIFAHRDEIITSGVSAATFDEIAFSYEIPEEKYAIFIGTTDSNHVCFIRIDTLADGTFAHSVYE